MLQNDLHKLYKWADTNNMKFNANKFELLRYGKEQEIKSTTTYKSYDNSNIDDKEQVRDLGIMMCNTATFILESLVIPLPECCCHLWNPFKAKDIQAIEAIQRTFTYKITEVQHLNYWERLHELKLYSLQRLREHYMIIYF